MDDGSKQEKYTGYTPPTMTGKESESAPVESTGRKSASPVLTDVPTKAESLTFAVEVSASNILAIQIMMGDFKALKSKLPASWMTSANGKIYWCADFTGHKVAIENEKLLVDDISAEDWLKKILAAKE